VNVWLFEPNCWGGGRWAGVPRSRSQTPPEILEAAQNRCEWIVGPGGPADLPSYGRFVDSVPHS